MTKGIDHTYSNIFPVLWGGGDTQILSVWLDEPTTLGSFVMVLSSKPFPFNHCKATTVLALVSLYGLLVLEPCIREMIPSSHVVLLCL